MGEESKSCIDEIHDHDDEKTFRKCVTDQLRLGEKRMDDMQAHIKENTESIAAIKSDTSELVEILKAVKGGLKVLGALGTVLKWIVGMVASVGALMALIKGQWPRN